MDYRNSYKERPLCPFCGGWSVMKIKESSEELWLCPDCDDVFTDADIEYLKNAKKQKEEQRAQAIKTAAENALDGDCRKLNDPKAVRSIREYMDENGIVDKKSVNRLVTGNPMENAGIREVIEYAFYLLERADDASCEEAIRIQNYFIAIENLISKDDIYILDDLEKLNGERHLAFVIDFMNRKFSDPKMIEIYEKIINYYTPGLMIDKLFFEYILGNEIRRDLVKLSAVDVRLEEKFLQTLCFAGIHRLSKRNINFGGILQALEFSIELHNVFEIFIREGYCKENDKSEDIDSLLTMYIVFGLRKELEKVIIEADEILLKMMISAWTNLIMKSRDIMLPEEMQEHIPSVIEFLCNIQVDKLSCCKAEWREMVKFIK